jgi:hypothetical protein
VKDSKYLEHIEKELKKVTLEFPSRKEDSEFVYRMNDSEGTLILMVYNNEPKLPYLKAFQLLSIHRQNGSG